MSGTSSLGGNLAAGNGGFLVAASRWVKVEGSPTSAKLGVCRASDSHLAVSAVEDVDEMLRRAGGALVNTRGKA